MRTILYNQEFENHLTQFDNFRKISIEIQKNPFKVMSNLKDCNELHLLAHGSPGHLDLGTGIDTEALYENAEYLSTLNVQKIILWGCHVGQDNKFIKAFSNLTNATVYASKDYLGKNKGLSDEFPSMNEFIKSLPFYLFFGNPEITSETQKLIASDGAASDYFGQSVNISGDYAIVGAHGNDDGGSQSGSAYIFEKGEVEKGCPYDGNNDGNVDIDDLIGVIDNWGPC